jgi:carboxyl-terminal processing protease
MIISKRKVVIALMVCSIFTSKLFTRGEKIDIGKDLAQVIKLIEENYYGDKEIDKEKMREMALGAVVESLGDKYSGFFTEMDMKSFQANLDGKYAGLGFSLEMKKNGELPSIEEVVENGPAAKNGIKKGDRIETIDGVSIVNETAKNILKKLRGEENSEIILGILSKEENKIKEIKLKREIINKKYVSASLLENNIGYLKIAQFGNNIYNDVEKNIRELQSRGMNSLILDLRDNPGGSLVEAVKVSSLFIGDGKIVSTRGKSGKEYVYNRQGNYLGNFPLVVLINEKSASASEICAGAIKDYKRGVLIGKKSYGKGSVQQTVPLKNGGGIKLTVAKYFTPLGNIIHEKGLLPHIVIDNEKEQLENAKSILKNYPIIETIAN